MCLVCDRIRMIREGTNPWFVKELETGYVVIGDNQHFKGYTLFLCKEHKTELFQLEHPVKLKFLEEMSVVAEAVSKAFEAEKMNYELLGNGIPTCIGTCSPESAAIWKTTETTAKVLCGGIQWRRCIVPTTALPRRNWNR